MVSTVAVWNAIRVVGRVALGIHPRHMGFNLGCVWGWDCMCVVGRVATLDSMRVVGRVGAWDCIGPRQ